MLASRLAGLRLGQVIGWLLVPVIYFGAVVFYQTLHELKLARANAAGLRLINLTYHAILDTSKGKLSSEDLSNFFDYGPALSDTAGVRNEFNSFRDALYDKTSKPEDVMRVGAKLMRAIGNGPALNDAGNREANYLATAVSEVMPSTLLSFRTLAAQTDAILKNPETFQQKLPDVDATAAELAYHTRELIEIINAARSSSADRSMYRTLFGIAADLNQDPAYFRSILLDPAGDKMGNLIKLSGALASMRNDWARQFENIWKGFEANLQAVTDARLASLYASMARTLCLSIATVAIGLGIALRMFRKSLRQLDDIEAARHEAEAAHRTLAMVNENLAEANVETLRHLQALEGAQSQLVKKGRLEQMGQLTATMAHELRNPLGSARTSLFLLERKTKGKGLGLDSQIQRITNAIMRCDDIITQLLDFSRSHPLEAAEADFDAWLESIMAEEAQRLPANMSLSCDLGLNGKRISFDSARLHRAVTNLISNASESFLATGDGRARVRRGGVEINVATFIKDGQVHLAVSDNGPGISDEIMAKVREPLFTTKSFGTGLGIPAVEQIAAQHGGGLDIVSTRGKGTTVTIRLPLQRNVEAA